MSDEEFEKAVEAIFGHPYMTPYVCRYEDGSFVVDGVFSNVEQLKALAELVERASH
jgi:hypothetical protein